MNSRQRSTPIKTRSAEASPRHTEPNNTYKFADVPRLGVLVHRRMTHDGQGKYLSLKIDKAPDPSADIVKILKATGKDVVVSYLPVGSEMATKRSAISPPGGERILGIQARFVGAMIKLRDNFPNQGIALFSHGDPVRAALMYFAGTPIDFWNRFEISVGSISIIVLGTDHVRILRVNEVPSQPKYRR